MWGRTEGLGTGQAAQQQAQESHHVMQGHAGVQEPPLHVPPAEMAACARVEADPDPEADQDPEERALLLAAPQSQG